MAMRASKLSTQLSTRSTGPFVRLPDLPQHRHVPAADQTREEGGLAINFKQYVKLWELHRK